MMFAAIFPAIVTPHSEIGLAVRTKNHFKVLIFKLIFQGHPLNPLSTQPGLSLFGASQGVVSQQAPLHRPRPVHYKL